MAVRLEIKRSIAPNNLWHWMVVFDNGHIFATSKEPYESAEICAVSASLAGLDTLHAAERAEKEQASDIPAATNTKVAPMEHPTFDRDEDPTDATLATIETWEPDFSEDGAILGQGSSSSAGMPGIWTMALYAKKRTKTVNRCCAS